MKKIIYLGLSFLSVFLLTACANEETKESQSQSQTQHETSVQQIAVGK